MKKKRKNAASNELALSATLPLGNPNIYFIDKIL